MTVGVPPCTVATTELVVPRSMPMTISATGLEALQKRLRLLVVRVFAEELRELAASARLHVHQHEAAGQRDAGGGVRGRSLDCPGRPVGRGGQVLDLQGAARGAQRGVGVALELEGCAIGG